MKENLFELKIKHSKLNKTHDCTIDDLDVVLNHLKKKAFRDSHCYDTVSGIG